MAFTTWKQTRTNLVKNLKYDPMILLGIHRHIIIQKASKIFCFFNPVCQNHLNHGSSKVFSRIIWRFFNGYQPTMTMNLVPSLSLCFLLSLCLTSCLSRIIWSSLSWTIACARLETDGNWSELELSASSEEETLSLQLQHKALHPLCWSFCFL